MPEIHIQQIFYSNLTREEVDEGFSGLDNMKNERPDWREYWPIRNYLLNASLSADAYYGFFSPKFKSKTNLDSSSVLQFVERDAGRSDVILFSPFFDQCAYPINIFEQGALQHKSIMRIFKDCISVVSPEVDLEALVTDSTNTVFCNYFVAKPKFWMAWLGKCELIFKIAEAGDSDLARLLNTNTSHDGRGVPAKVFVIERIASLMLSTQRGWSTKAYNSISLPWSNAPIAQFRLEMVILDSLKIAYATQGHAQYLDAFHRWRQISGKPVRFS